MALRVDDVDLVRDRALVQRFQEGDGAAFETLYRRYFARLKRFCQKRVGDPLEAEEIAQEAFTRALRALPTFDGERRFYPWMTVIAGRLCVDVHRRRMRSNPTAEVDPGATDGGQDRIVDAAEVVVLSSALDRLAPRHREVLDLRERRNWSYRQIADHYGVTLGTVEALLFRARKALRREFLAASGGEAHRVAVPVLGLLARPAAALRGRLELWFSAVPPLAGPVVSVAVGVAAIVASVAAGDWVDPPAPAPAPAPRAPLQLQSELPTPEPPAAPTPAGARATVAAASAAGPAAVESPAPAPGGIITSADDADRRGAQKPLQVGVDGVATVYLSDPAEVAADAAAGAAGALRTGVGK